MINHVFEIFVKNSTRHIDEIYRKDINFYQCFKNFKLDPDTRNIYII